MAAEGWRWCGKAMSTASTSGSFNTSATSVYARYFLLRLALGGEVGLAVAHCY